MKRKAFLEVGKLYTNRFNKFPDMHSFSKEEKVFYRIYDFWHIDEISLETKKNLVFMYLGGEKTSPRQLGYYYPFITGDKIVYIRDHGLYYMKRCPKTLGVPKHKS